MAEQGKAAAGPELRPAPVFAIGLTGHRSVGLEGETAAAAEACIAALLDDLKQAFGRTLAAEPHYFAPSPPTLRLVTMAADGADLLGARAARAKGAELSLVLPYLRADYANDFKGPALGEFEGIVAVATTILELPGTREEGPRSYERANEFILAHVDLLIAVWDGQRANGRGGTGDVVQAAVMARIPVVVIDPSSKRLPELISHPANREFDPPFATDLLRRPLSRDLQGLTDELLLPSRNVRRHSGFTDMLAEPQRRHFRRVEYNLFMKIFQPRPSARRASAAMPAVDPWDSSIAFGRMIDLAFAERMEAVAAISRRTDDLANYYSEIYRSSTVTRFLGVVVVAFVAAVVGLLFPRWSYFSLGAQMFINAVVLVDSALGMLWRWQERWLDYRSITERLRALRFLQVLGVRPTETGSPFLFASKSWTSWYVDRISVALGMPNGRMYPPNDASTQLLAADILEQVEYHRRVYRSRASLERRLAAVASLALYAAIAVGGMLGLAIYMKGGIDKVGGASFASVLLSILPATMTALRGYRADADLIRLTERSAMTAAALAAIRRTLSAAPLTFDRLRVAGTHIASVTSGELTEWRFILESRSTRLFARGMKTPWQRLARLWARLRGRLVVH